MPDFQLAEIVTKDKLVHQGIFFSPSHKAAPSRAILWVHGLTGRFYGDVALMNLFAEACEKQGLGFASFNNRGHDMVSGVRKIDKRKKTGYAHNIIGAGYERFEDSVFDVDAGISFLAKRGFSQIIIVGHSTGANKVCFYAGARRDPRVFGIVLAGPMSDRYSRNTNKRAYKKNLLFMQKLVKEKKENNLLVGHHFFPMTPKRWLSLLAPGSKEDVFNYGDTKGALSLFAKMQKPLLVVLSGEDETADRPIEDIKKVFDSHAQATSYKSIVIAAVPHSYTGKENEFITHVMSWASSL